MGNPSEGACLDLKPVLTLVSMQVATTVNIPVKMEKTPGMLMIGPKSTRRASMSGCGATLTQVAPVCSRTGSSPQGEKLSVLIRLLLHIPHRNSDFLDHMYWLED